jgi:hypothetical protein
LDHRLARSAINAVLIAALIGLFLLFGWRFLQDPSRLAPTRDPAWYTWRTRALLETGPAVLIEKHGPFGMLSGGYRVTTPVLGALLFRVAGVDPLRFTVLLGVGLPVLTAAALGAFAFRHRRDHLMFVLTMLATAPLFLTVPFIGYMDNLMALFLLAVALSFLEPAGVSWGARIALGLLLFLASLTHPTTALLFTLMLSAGAGLRLLGTRFSIRKVLERDGPMLLAAGVGLGLGLIAWRAGLWGPRATLSDAVLTQPYTEAFFRSRLHVWVRSLHPRVTVPVAALAVGWILWRLFRDRTVDRHAAVSVLWLLPLVGVFGFALGYAYPYYRFINVTLALMLLLGLGAWLLTRPLWWVGTRIGDQWRLVPVAGVAVILVALGALYVQPGLRLWDRQGPWASNRILAALAGVRAYAAAEPGRPVVFVIHPNDQTRRAWGLAKQSSNITLAGLDGGEVPRTFLYVGEPEDFLAGRPTLTGYPVFDDLSRGFLQDFQQGAARYSLAPVAFYLPMQNASGTPPPDSATVPVTDGVDLLRGPGLADPSPAAAQAADRAARREAQVLAIKPGPADDLRHLARVVLGLVLLLVVPGLMAMDWFGLRDLPSRLALVPGLSVALVIAAGILVTAVHRGPFGAVDGWASLALAFMAAAGLAVLARRRPTRPPVVVAEPRVAVTPLG